jgi:hypothetical protein
LPEEIKPDEIKKEETKKPEPQGPGFLRFYLLLSAYSTHQQLFLNPARPIHPGITPAESWHVIH